MPLSTGDLTKQQGRTEVGEATDMANAAWELGC